MVGRFVDHDGGQTNAPAVRFGQISVMATQKIKQPNNAYKENYCLDIRSRTGYSGSPVFAYRTPLSDLRDGNLNMGNQFLYLLGIHWGQFPEQWQIVDGEVPEAYKESEPLITDGKYVKGVSGMCCASPASAISEILHLEKFVIQRQRAGEAWQRSHPKVDDVPEAETEERALPTTADNPSHAEDFNRLLGAATRTPASDGET